MRKSSKFLWLSIAGIIAWAFVMSNVEEASDSSHVLCWLCNTIMSCCIFIGLPMSYIIRSREKGKPKKWPYVIVVYGVICALVALTETVSLIDKMAETTQTTTPLPTAVPTYTSTPTATPTATPTPTPTAIPTATPSVGESRNTAYALTADEFVKEIKKNKEAAAGKFNDQYVEITGKVTYISSHRSMTGYYVYGKQGGSGLKITCWVDAKNDTGLSVGDTATFQGIVREVTTVNNTEIGECLIIK